MAYLLIRHSITPSQYVNMSAGEQLLIRAICELEAEGKA